LPWNSTYFEQDQAGTVFWNCVPASSCSKAACKHVWYIPLLSVQWINSWWLAEELPEICRVSWQNKFEKLFRLFGFIKKKFWYVYIRLHGVITKSTTTFVLFLNKQPTMIFPNCVLDHSSYTMLSTDSGKLTASFDLTSFVHLTWVTFTTVGAKVRVLNICSGEELPHGGKCSQVTIVCQMHESLEWSTLFLLPGGEKSFFSVPNSNPLWGSLAPLINGYSLPF